jgi:hypothetical protein
VIHELPTKIRTAKSMGLFVYLFLKVLLEAYEQVVKYYQQSKQAVKLFPQVQSIGNEHRECEKVAMKLKVELEERINDKKRSLDEISGDIDLLLQLGSRPEDLAPKLEQQYFKIIYLFIIYLFLFYFIFFFFE